VIAALAVATAAEPGLDAEGELRAFETLPVDFPVDDAGGTLGWGPAVDTRARLRLHWTAPEGAWRAEAEGDAFSGQLFGDTWALPELDERGRAANDAVSAAGLVPRALTLGGRLPWFDLEAGLTTATWGLGLVANDGRTDPLFGRTDFGDRTLRVRLATAPFRSAAGPDGRLPLYVLVVGDRVVTDELARWSAGDRAYQAILATLLVRDLPALDGRAGTRRTGAYAVVRDQVSSTGEHLRAHVLDAFVDWTLRPGRWSVRLAGEGAWTFGSTDASRTYLSPEGVRVRQGGATVRTELGRGPWTAHLRGNWASGDTSTDDDVVSEFRFDRDLDVGMVLFDEYLSALNLAAWRSATDPARAADPPDGIDLLVDEGAFHGATALQPALVLNATPGLQVRVGGVFSWSTGPIANPYTSFVNGGVPSNQFGRSTGDRRWLGSELDWAIATRELPFTTWAVRPSLELQVGHAWPGAALGQDRVDLVLLAARARL
jgi:hypothetical protein